MLKEASFAAMGTPAAVLTEDNLRRLYNIDARIVSLSVEGQGEINEECVPIRTSLDRSQEQKGVTREHDAKKYG